MNTVVPALLVAFIASCQGITITFPVKISPIAGLWPPSASWGNCHSEVRPGHGLIQSNKECVLDKLKSTCGFTASQADTLLQAASTMVGRPPHASGQQVGVDSCSKQCMCNVASDCSCQITQDWCSRDLRSACSNERSR